MHIEQKIILWFFIIILLPIVFFSLGTIGFWIQLDAPQQKFLIELIQKNAAYIYVSISLFLFFMAAISKWLFFSYFIPLKKLTEDTSILTQASHSNPIKTKGGKELRNLVEVINKLAKKNLTEKDSIHSKSGELNDRPEFVDYDIFRHSSGFDNLDTLPLAKLKYVIFDTETTGLYPNNGDEIISIGAVQILKRKLLDDNRFDALVNPQRKISREAEKITGISQGMLENQPVLKDVLPEFYNYCRDFILVGHNVAFDMRFIELKEKQFNLKFDNPVLDTLLLSAAVHPFQESHSLDAIAERFGITIKDRHTALGDAIITAEVFIKLLSILEEKGIETLKQATEVSQKTFYARIKY